MGLRPFQTQADWNNAIRVVVPNRPIGRKKASLGDAVRRVGPGELGLARSCSLLGKMERLCELWALVKMSFLNRTVVTA